MFPKLAAILLVIVAASAEQAVFTPCDEYISTCTIQEVRISPCSNPSQCALRKGATTQLEFDFIPKFAAEKLKTAVYYVNQGTELSFPDLDIDACKFTGCPTEADKAQTFNYSLYIAKKLPSGINKRFQRLESHVVTLARSVAHLSSEMRTQHLVMQEMDNIRAEISALRHMYKSQQYLRSGHQQQHLDPYSFSNPDRVKRLTKFFGDEPPLMRLFLKKLGYEKYAAMLEKEKVGAAELPYVGEDKLRALGVPLGPRMRILKEAGLHQDLRHSPRDDLNTTTTLAIV